MVALAPGQQFAFPRFLVASTASAKASTYMPRIPDDQVNSVVFLYRDRDEAKRHAKSGGTAFIIGRPLIIDGQSTRQYVPYLVSNRHVVWTCGCPIPRINRRDGGEPDVLDTLECDKWIVHPGGADVAIVPLCSLIDIAIHKVGFISTEEFVTKEQINSPPVNLGVGDEVIMLGRLVNHQGKRENRPIARFGSISMTPEPIRNPALCRDEESFAVEMRSRTGFSGSPVLIYRIPSTTLIDVQTKLFVGLLGVNWGYILDESEENTWINGVVPAWKIIETLETPELMRVQKDEEENWKNAARETKDSGIMVAAASGGLSVSETLANPHHREEFTSLLNEAAKKKPQDDQT